MANKSYFEYAYTEDKPIGIRFGQAMVAASSSPFNLVALYEPLLSASKGTTLVDIGGGNGHVAITAARKFPNLRCVIQDKGMVVGEGRNSLPEELKGRVEFQENDFFKGQPIGGPRVYYYLKHILHNHPDPCVSILSTFMSEGVLTGWEGNCACKKILSHIANAMDSSSRILMDERAGPEGDWMAITKDLHMLVMYNGKERTEAQWAALLKSADERLVVEKVWRTKDNTGIIEARLACGVHRAMLAKL